MSSYTITFEMTETIEAEDKQSAIEEFIEKLKEMSSEKIETAFLTLILNNKYELIERVSGRNGKTERS